MSTQQDLNYLSMLSRKNAELKARVNSQINAINANSAQLQQGIFMQGNPAVLAKQPTVAQTQGNAMSNTAFSAVFAKAESIFFWRLRRKGRNRLLRIRAGRNEGGRSGPSPYSGRNVQQDKRKPCMHILRSFKNAVGRPYFLQGDAGRKRRSYACRNLYKGRENVSERKRDKWSGNCAGRLQVYA